MRESSTVSQLRILNELFACTNASSCDSAEHVRRVLDFVSEEQSKHFLELSFADSADRLAKLHFGHNSEGKLKFSHWSMRTDNYFEPLWLRQALISQMRQFAGSRIAFLLITGLHEAICPKGHYWTKKRQKHYDDICSYINELCCALSTPDLQLQVVFLESDES